MKENLAGNVSSSASSTALDALSAASDHLSLVSDELDQLHRLAMLGILSAGLAHEINNILTPVIAYAHAALAADSDGRLKSKALRKALHGAESVTSIVSGTLSASSMSDNPGQTDTRAAFANAVNALGRNPKRDGIELANDLPSDLFVTISPVALQQVFMNLLLNACNAMSGTAGRIEIRAARKGSEVELCFADNGPGIPESIRDQVFQPFVTKATHNRTANSTGTGLGLAVCRMLIESAGGSIAVDTESDSGTTFSILLTAATNQKERVSKQNAA